MLHYSILYYIILYYIILYYIGCSEADVRDGDGDGDGEPGAERDAQQASPLDGFNHNKWLNLPLCR